MTRFGVIEAARAVQMEHDVPMVPRHILKDLIMVIAAEVDTFNLSQVFRDTLGKAKEAARAAYPTTAPARAEISAAAVWRDRWNSLT